MARIALCLPALPSHAAVHGTLARELARRGHRVIFVGGDTLSPLALREGVAFHSLGAREPDLRGAQLVRTLIATAGATWLWVRQGPQALGDLAPDLAIVDQAEPGAALAAEAAGCPRITLTAGLPMDRDARVPPPFVPWPHLDGAEGEKRNRGGWAVTDALMALQAQALLAGCRRQGLAPRGRLDDWVSGDLDLRQWPLAFDFPHDLPRGAVVVGPLRDPLPPGRGSRRTRPVAFASLGTLGGRRRRVLGAIIAAAARMDLRLILSDAGTLGPGERATVPGRLRRRDFWPQRAVLARAGLCVTHGGMNTVLDALAAQVPMVIVPLSFEQPGTAARLAHHGLARVVPRRDATPDRLAEAMACALRDEALPARLAQAAATLQAAGGTARAADLVEAYLARATRMAA